jgi:hypothetical protein
MQTGDLIEDFTLPDQDGAPTTLSSFAGKPVVLFFYPKADTPGCTVEACEFRDQFPKFKKLQDTGVVILGISRDTVKAQKKFKENTICPTRCSPTPIRRSSSASISSSPRRCTANSSPASSGRPTSSAPTASSSTSSPRSSPKATRKKFLPSSKITLKK